MSPTSNYPRLNARSYLTHAFSPIFLPLILALHAGLCVLFLYKKIVLLGFLFFAFGYFGHLNSGSRKSSYIAQSPTKQINIAPS